MSLRALNFQTKLWLVSFTFLGCATSNVHRNWVDPSFRPNLLVVEQVTVGSTAIRIDCNRVANVSRQYLIEELIGSGLPCLVIDGITLTSKVGTAIAIALDSTTALLSAEISITAIQVLGRARCSFSSCYTAMLS